MWVNAKVFMELVQAVEELRFENKRLREDVETLKKRPIIVERKNSEDDIDAETLLDELLNGKADKSGRIIYTDGRK